MNFCFFFITNKFFNILRSYNLKNICLKKNSFWFYIFLIFLLIQKWCGIAKEFIIKCYSYLVNAKGEEYNDTVIDTIMLELKGCMHKNMIYLIQGGNVSESKYKRILNRI